MPISLITCHQKRLIIVLVLVALNLAVYHQVLNFNFINYDDNIYVTHNPQVQTGINYRTLALLSRILEKQTGIPDDAVTCLDGSYLGTGRAGFTGRSDPSHFKYGIVVFIA